MEFSFGREEYVPFEHFENYSGHQVGEFMDRGYNTLALGSWVLQDTLFIKLSVVDLYVGGINTIIKFKDDQVVLKMEKNAEYFLYQYNGEAIGNIEK